MHIKTDANEDNSKSEIMVNAKQKSKQMMREPTLKSAQKVSQLSKVELCIY